MFIYSEEENNRLRDHLPGQRGEGVGGEGGVRGILVCQSDSGPFSHSVEFDPPDDIFFKFLSFFNWNILLLPTKQFGKGQTNIDWHCPHLTYYIQVYNSGYKGWTLTQILEILRDSAKYSLTTCWESQGPKSFTPRSRKTWISISKLTRF